MENEKVKSLMDKETTFFDLCVACARAIGRCCQSLLGVLARMVRMSYRYWWIVLTLLVLAVAAALYYTRPDNLTYKANAVAMLNGPTVQQFEQAFAPLRSGKLLPQDSRLDSLLAECKVTAFDTYRVIDCMDDGMADYIDFKHSVSPTDTVNVQMQDRICIQFRVKARNVELLPEAEQELLTFLNANEAMQSAYSVYMRNMEEKVQFNHSQLTKLDSLTTHYYFHGHPGAEPLNTVRDGLVFMGDWRVHLFLHEIYDHQDHSEKVDKRMQFATAPVVLENHFSLDPKPVNSRAKYLFIFLLLGWAGGYILAELIDKRKALNAWLKA